MFSFNTLAFLVFPYVVLTVFILGHAYRYRTDMYHWNSRSSEILDKGSLKIPVVIFHYGIIVTFLGHLTGLLTPQWFLDRWGISAEVHEFVALSVGMVIGAMALIGLILLLARRLTVPRIFVTSSINDLAVLVLLIIAVGLGTFNAFFPSYDVLHSVAPWIQGIVTLGPDPELMRPVPWTYKVHILAAFTVLGFSPFTRLVHIWSVPLQYLFRRHVIIRRRELQMQ
jgi:nitrate reductase gamma subunit